MFYKIFGSVEEIHIVCNFGNFWMQKFLEILKITLTMADPKLRLENAKNGQWCSNCIQDSNTNSRRSERDPNCSNFVQNFGWAFFKKNLPTAQNKVPENVVFLPKWPNIKDFKFVAFVLNKCMNKSSHPCLLKVFRTICV